MNNMNERVSTSAEVHKKQIKVVAVGLTTLIVIIIGFCWLGSNTDQNTDNQDKIGEKVPVYDVTQAVDDKSYWVFESERKLAEQSAQQTQLLKQIEEIRGSISQNYDESINGNENQELGQLKDKIEQLEEQISQLTEVSNWKSESPKEQWERPSALSAKAANQYLPEPDYYGPSVASAALPLQSMGIGSIYSETIALEDRPEDKLHHIDNYIPAATYVGARLLNGADVSVGLTSQSDPQPLTLRLIDNGSLPNHMSSRLHDCRVIVAARGILSSERVEMRLEKLSCVEPDGHPIDTDIEGVVVGKDGKNGVRGKMVIRDGEMLKRGFVGGFLSGLGNAAAQSFSTSSISPLGSISTVQGADLIKNAGAQGVGNAFELMAKYNIQRAEQYQPIIQISGGQDVHIVFTNGVKLGEKRKKRVEQNQNKEKPHIFLGE